MNAADVEAAFGGSSSADKVDENGACAFEVSGTIHAGPNVSVPGSVGMSFSDNYDTYDRAKVLFGNTLTKVDGLGTQAWYGLTAVHAKTAGGELVVAGFWVGDFVRHPQSGHDHAGEDGPLAGLTEAAMDRVKCTPHEPSRGSSGSPAIQHGSPLAVDG